MCRITDNNKYALLVMFSFALCGSQTESDEIWGISPSFCYLTFTLSILFRLYTLADFQKARVLLNELLLQINLQWIAGYFFFDFWAVPSTQTTTNALCYFSMARYPTYELRELAFSIEGYCISTPLGWRAVFQYYFFLLLTKPRIARAILGLRAM